MHYYKKYSLKLTQHYDEFDQISLEAYDLTEEDLKNLIRGPLMKDVKKQFKHSPSYYRPISNSDSDRFNLDPDLVIPTTDVDLEGSAVVELMSNLSKFFWPSMLQAIDLVRKVRFSKYCKEKSSDKLKHEMACDIDGSAYLAVPSKSVPNYTMKEIRTAERYYFVQWDGASPERRLDDDNWNLAVPNKLPIETSPPIHSYGSYVKGDTAIESRKIYWGCQNGCDVIQTLIQLLKTFHPHMVEARYEVFEETFTSQKMEIHGVPLSEKIRIWEKEHANKPLVSQHLILSQSTRK